jgi:hypothetical protein
MRNTLGVVSVVLLTCISQGISAATWYVDDSVSFSGDGKTPATAFRKVQEGIDAASDGDTVIVAEGTYVENIQFKGKNIILTSTDPLDPTVVANTIIDGNQAGSVVTFGGTEDESCILSGFTVRNGKTVSNGGGICGGAGDARTRAAIRHNVITGNSAPNGSGAGLAFCCGPIQNNVICDNSAYWYGGGLFECNGIIENNLILRNSGNDGGGGVSHCDAVIQNNTITGNTSYRGGGVYICFDAIRNCIIWGNTATSPHPDKQVRDSFYPVFSCIQDWGSGGVGNISADPLFIDAASGDYHLQDLSPCIDMGQGFYWSAWPQRDLDGNCRLVGDGIDMGCYEHASSRDSDGDLLSDSDEAVRKTEPRNDDTDADGLRDGLEVIRRSDPLQTTQPGIIHVPEDMGTIQQSLCVALAGDEIIVGVGRHRENLRFPGADIILRSSDPEDGSVVESTILDGAGVGSVVCFTGDESESCVLTGFTILGGRAYKGAGICGGTEDKRTHATIENNVITANSVELPGDFIGGLGGGMAFCDGSIRGNTISENYAGWEGGGLYECSGTIQGNVISDNQTAQFGGGLGHCDGAIQENRVSDNSAAEGGGGMYVCWGVIENNVIAANWAGLDGGGLRSCFGTIQNDTIYGNWSQSGGALQSCNGVIRNCIIWENAVFEGSQMNECSTPSFSCIKDWGGGGNGNIELDPLFADLWGDDYHLASGSPCIDAGVNYYWSVWPQRDADGNCRLVGERVDMGCYEYGSSPDSDGDLLSDQEEASRKTDPVDADSDGDGLLDGLEVLRGTDPLQKTPPAVIRIPDEVATIQPCLCLAMSGDEIIVSPGVYPENLLFCGADAVLRSSDPQDSDAVTSTILEGSAAGTVVSFSGRETEKCLLTGFTIRNGNGGRGGGICGGTWVQHTRAAIENNVISENTAAVGGGVAWCDGVIRRNTISGNSARSGGGLSECAGLIENNSIETNSSTYDDGGGGGLYACDGVVRSNVISGNSAAGDGGALDSCDGIVENNAISGNSAGRSGGGLYECEGTVTDNMISQNSADAFGGGLSHCGATVKNNIISGNAANYSGGGLDYCNGVVEGNVITGNSTRENGGGTNNCEGIIRNDTITANTAGMNGGGINACGGTIVNSIIWGNTAPASPQLYESSTPTFSCIQYWTGGGEGNISPKHGPGFVDPDGPDNDPQTYEDNDYRLLPGSPCINAGENHKWMSSAGDLDGNPRISEGTVDMGAYEYLFEITKTPDGETELRWSSRPYLVYAVWSCDDLATATWQKDADVISDGVTTSWTIGPLLGPRKFYRVQVK